MKKFTTITAFFLAAVLLLTFGCPVKAEGDQEPFEITVQYGSEPLSIDPNAEIGNDVITMNCHMWESLYKRGEGNKLEPGMAESVDISDDKMTYTFHLRDGIKWSDGEPVTAKQFEYSWKRLVTGGYDYSSFLDNVVNALDIRTKGADVDTLGIEAPDDKTFIVHLTSPIPYFLEICAYGVTVPMRQDIIEEHGDDWSLSPETFISNGAYKLDEWVNQEKLVMVKNPEYYEKDKIGPDKITWLFMDDDNASLAAFESGTVMFTSHFPSEEIQRLKDAGFFQTQSQIGTYYLQIESSEKGVPELQIPKVRRALSLAIDRKYIVDNITKGGEIPADGYLPYGFTDSKGDNYKKNSKLWWDLDDYEASKEEAKKLMDEAGFPDGKGFPVIRYMVNNGSNHQAIAEYIQDCWKNVLGVNASVEAQEWGVFLDTRAHGDYQLARAGWTVDFHDPDGLMNLFVSHDGNNDSHWSNEDYDKLIGESKVEPDPDKRLELFHQAEDIMMEQGACIPLYYYVDKYLLDTTKYEGFFSDVDGSHFQYLRKIEK